MLVETSDMVMEPMSARQKAMRKVIPLEWQLEPTLALQLGRALVPARRTAYTTGLVQQV